MKESQIRMNSSGEQSGMSGKDGALAGVTALLLASVLFLSGCHDKVSPGTAEVKRPPVSGVAVEELKPAMVDDYYETSGTIRAKNISVIASRIMGSVTSLPVHEGQRVQKGQTLLTIDDSDSSQKVAAAAGAVESAQQKKQLADVTFARYAKLYEEKALSRQEFDQMETEKNIAASELVRAKALLKEARAYQGYAHIRAPFSGIVTGKKIDPGSMAAPGMQLLTVEDTAAFLIEASVDERLSSRLRTGSSIDVIIDALNLSARGKISEIVPAIDPISRTFILKAAIKGRGLRSGLYARIRIPIGARNALIAPLSAIAEKGQLTGVYTVDPKGVISYRLVRTGKSFGSKIEILSGLNAGDRIIVSGIDKAIDGGLITGQQSGASEK